MPTLLNEAEIISHLALLPEWTRGEGCILRRYDFQSFAEAMTFMAKVAEVAERLDHHPDWRNVYNRVDVTLTTHDAGGLTRLDFTLAREMDAAFRRAPS